PADRTAERIGRPGLAPLRRGRELPSRLDRHALLDVPRTRLGRSTTAAQGVPPLLRRSGYPLLDLHTLTGSERAPRGGFFDGGHGSAAPRPAGAHHRVRDAAARRRPPLARPGDGGRAEARGEAHPEARMNGRPVAVAQHAWHWYCGRLMSRAGGAPNRTVTDATTHQYGSLERRLSCTGAMGSCSSGV